MPLAKDHREAQLVLMVEGWQPEDFLVTRYRGTEGMCQLYRFEIDFATDASSVDFAAIVGKPASLTINADVGPRWFHGLISHLEMTGETAEIVYYRAILVPTVWLLTQKYRSRIFQEHNCQDMTALGIVKKVLEENGITSERLSVNVTGAMAAREYCVQYRETDYNFVSRLLEEEGIRWYFNQTIDGHILVLDDSVANQEMIEGESAELPFVGPAGMNLDKDHIFRFRMGQSVRPGKVTLQDFNFTNPTLPLMSQCDAGERTNLEFYDFPGEYGTQADGTRYAELRTQEFETTRSVGVGMSNCFRLATGRVFQLTEHPAEPLNGQYLITSIMHQGRQSITRTVTSATLRAGSILPQDVRTAVVSATQIGDPTIRSLAYGLLEVAGRLAPGDASVRRELANWLYHNGQMVKDLATVFAALGGSATGALGMPNLLEDEASLGDLDYTAPTYQCRFECIPAAVTYRPSRVAPWPRIQGTQTARVVGPQGEEIHCDEYGRVKVQFHWDLQGKFDDKSSCFIRVSQSMAGGQYGMMFLPRVGQEVVVEFLEGDPDKPLIIGSVFNNDHMPPYGLPDNKTRTVIKTRSSKGGGGSHEIRFDDLKDSEQMLIYGQKDLHIRFKNDKVENIENDTHLTIGNDRKEIVKKNYHLKIEEGEKREEIGTDLSQKVKGKTSILVEGTHSVEVKGDAVEKFGANLKQDVTATYAVKGASVKIEASSGIEIKCGGSSICLSPGGIFIVGTAVNINSGPGPAVGPVTASATAPQAPEDPIEADEVEHGADKTYAGGEEQAPDEAPEDQEGKEVESSEEDAEPNSWIDIELKDEEGNPVPGERYKVVDPAGKEHEGTLDANGRAHIANIPPGECEITYPNLDQSAVEQKS